jgi:transcriptional regulator with XRE-family HTH domain
MEQRKKRNESREVRQMKMELVAAHERGESAVLRQMGQRYPAQVEMLADFVAGLYATDLDEQEIALPITPDLEALSTRARQRALGAVFGTTSAAQAASPLLSSLAQARRAADLSLVELARRLALGADVVQKLEQGRIAVASLPQKLADRLAEVLSMTSEQAMNLLRAAPATQAQPALMRWRPKAGGKAAQPEDVPAEAQSFAQAVQHSPSMAAEQRAFWLEESAG